METVGLGLYFEDLPVGRRFKRIGRTATEADITNFVKSKHITTDGKFAETLCFRRRAAGAGDRSLGSDPP